MNWVRQQIYRPQGTSINTDFHRSTHGKIRVELGGEAAQPH
ncbi:MAG: hypothetical protein VKJ85_12930 [Prochlorothrix sp.]|nr:hypothetical protein [Prochlorothrix sp.]